MDDCSVLFQYLIETSNDAIFIADADTGIIIRANKKAEELLNIPLGNILGMHQSELHPPEERERYKAIFREHAEKGFAITETLYVQNSSGDSIPVEISASLIELNGRRVIQGIFRNITERVRYEDIQQRMQRILRVTSECNNALLHIKDETALMNKICHIVVETGQYRMAWIGFAENDSLKSVTPVAKWGFEEGYLEKAAISWGNNERGKGPTGTAIRTGKLYIAKDIHKDKSFIPWREQAVKRGYSSSISLPLFTNENIIGALNIYAAEADAFNEEEVKLLSHIADNLSYGITSLMTAAEREKAERSLHQYADIVKNMQIGLYIYHLEDIKDDRTLRMIAANPASFELTGVPVKEILGKTLDENFPGLREKGIPQIYAKVVTSGKAEVLEDVYYGDERVVEGTYSVKAFPLPGNCLGIAFENITERVKAEEELKKSELQWSYAMDFIDDPLYLIGLDDKVIQANRSFYHMTGLTPAEVIGKDITKIMHPNGEALPCPVCAARRDRRDASIIMEAGHPDNPFGRPIEVMVKIIHDKNGSPLQIMKTIRDLTDIEEMRKQAHIIDQVNDSVVTTDMDGNITSWNKGAEKLFGYKADEVKGRNISILYPEDEHEFLNNHVIIPLKQKGCHEAEVKLHKKSKEVFHAVLSLSLLKNTQGNPIGMIGSSRDITERRHFEEILKKSEQSLRIHAKELEESNIALKVLLKQRETDKTDFEENILSNIKNLILPYIEKLKENRAMSEELSYLNIIESNLNEIISPFSSRLSSQYLGFTPTETRLANLIKEGKQDKDIMKILNISLHTVKTHRQNIRKKLGIYSKRTNLRTHLLSINT